MFSTVNQQAFGGEEGLLAGKDMGGCREDLSDTKRICYDSLMER